MIVEILYRHDSRWEKPLFSLIVLSKDDPRLFTCLKSIQEAEHADRIELVVALDASPLAYTQQVLRVLGDVQMAVVVGRTAQQETISSMRNRGASLASGNMLVYIDSDCMLASNFVVEVAPLIEAGHPLMTGQVLFKARSHSWFSQKNSQVRQNEYSHLFRSYVRSPNLLIHRDLLAFVGGFEPHVPYGDDFLLNQKCRLAGYAPRYCETLVMEHHDDERVWKTIRTCFGYGIGNAYRYKRERRIAGGATPFPISFSSHMFHASWDLTLFCWFRSAVINLGFVYGLSHWRETDIIPLPFSLASETGCEAHRYQRPG